MGLVGTTKFFKKLPVEHLVLLIISVSFISRMATGYVLRDSFFHRGNSYGALNAIAFNLANHFEYAIESGIPSIDYEPLYPLILAISYKLFGANWFGVTIIQGIIFGITSYLLFLIGKILKNELAGLVAAAYHSFYPYLFFHSLHVVDTTQYIFVVTLLLYFVLRNIESHRTFWYYVWSGSLTGLALLSRGSALAILPPIILYALLKPRDRRILKSAAIMSVAALVILSPWLIRNYQYTKTFIISTHGPFGLWQGNNEYSYNYLKNNISLDEIYRLKPPPIIYRENPTKPRPPKEATKVAQKYKAEALRFIMNNPDEFMKLCWIKFIKFWSWTYNPIMSSYIRGTIENRQWVYFISYVPLLSSLPFGLYFLLKKSWMLFLLFGGIIITYTAAHMVVIGFSRARLPLDPLLMVFLGITMSTLYSKIRTTSNFKN